MERKSKEIMTTNFKAFAASVATHFSNTMSHQELFRVDIEGDELWELYLEAFPSGSNPMFRKRTQHDGSYDRHTIRRVGNVVAVIRGQFVSIWDAPDLESPYKEVAKVLSSKVKAAVIVSLFRTKETVFGYETTKERLEDGSFYTWNHFHVCIAKKHQSSEVGKDLGDASTTRSVLERGLEEITPDALKEIVDLIDSDALYRGDEHLAQVQEFRALQYLYSLKDKSRDTFLWTSLGTRVARFRNTVIGTLAVDLSEGKGLEQSVAAFESKVAPQNYKRPTALITAGMVKEAMKTIASLDLEPALERRYAKLSDVSVNNVVWVSNSAKPVMKGGIADLLAEAVTKKPVSTGKVEEIGIESFIAEVMPKARSLEMLVQGKHQKNLVSITAPVHAKSAFLFNAFLFKWYNAFAWSYNGDITDAIKERVKKAGGNIKADLRVSLAWHNHDDLDLHARCPYGHVYFADKKGILDVDMNAGGGTTRSPVENLAFIQPKDGPYTISVNQFSRRETTNPGFTVETECEGVVQQFTYSLAVADKTRVEVVEFQMKDGKISDLRVIDKNLKAEGVSQVVWGIQTESFVPVSTVMYSPNHWNGKKIGNLHTFFILENCANPEATRGIYNEFLRSDLEQHRRVFEVLGSKTKCEPTPEQLSGLGFSSTVRESVTVRVIGQTINKLYKINF